MKKIVLPNDIVIGEVKKLIDEGHEVSLRVKGNSMLPFIRGGEDLVLLRSLDTPLQRWDIVLARDLDQRLVIHRVIKIAPDCITLMGDGNLEFTEQCLLADIIARVVQIQKDDRLIDCTTTAMRRKAIWWHRLLPIRRYLLAIYRRIN